MSQPTEIIVYRNPAEKMLWDFWMNLPVEAWYAVGFVIGFLAGAYALNRLYNWWLRRGHRQRGFRL